MLNQPFFQVSLPITITILGTVWALSSSNNRRLDDISARLGRIEDDCSPSKLGFPRSKEKSMRWNSRHGGE